MSKICLGLVSKRKQPKKYQVDDSFFKIQVYINWSI